jgi:hypothetical protein
MSSIRKKLIGSVLLPGFVGAMLFASAGATPNSEAKYSTMDTQPSPISRPGQMLRACVDPGYQECRRSGGNHSQCKPYCQREN